MCTGGKVLVAAATTSAMSDDEFLIGFREIKKPLTGVVVVNNGADRDLENDVLAVATGAVGTFTVAPAITFVFGVEAEMNQRVMAFTGFHHDVAALAAVATGWSAAGYEFFPAKRHTAVTAVACFDTDNSFVYKHEFKRRTGKLPDSPIKPSVLIVQSGCWIHGNPSPAQRRGCGKSKTMISVLAGHGGYALVHLFLRNYLDLCGYVPVVPAHVFHAGSKVTVKLFRGFHQ